MTIQTAFDIGDTVRPVDERTFSNWGSGVIDEIDITVRGQVFSLAYYVKVKKHGGYRLRFAENEIQRT